MNDLNINADWFNKWYGKGYDIDGAAGLQCVDLFKIVLKEMGHPNPAAPIGGDGWAHSIWYNRANWKDYFDEIPKSQVQYGDVIVFGKGGMTPYSHVAICAGYTSTGQIISFGMNQADSKVGAYCSYCNLPITTLLGGLRPKHPGKVYWNYDAVLSIGDIVSSRTLPIQDIDTRTGQVLVDALGGYVPACDLIEAESTKDGACDQVIMNLDSKVYLAEARIEMINYDKNIVMINGYWVLPDQLCRKEYV